MANYPEYWELATFGYSLIESLWKKYNLTSTEKFSMQTQFSHFLYQVDSIVDTKLSKSEQNKDNFPREDNLDVRKV